MKRNRLIFNVSDTTATVLRSIPVYPKEYSLPRLAEKFGISKKSLSYVINSLPSYLPLAERKNGKIDLYCYPTQQAKNNVLQMIRRRAI